MNLEKIREDFPILDEKINGKKIVYFDNACVTLKPKQVIEAMNEYYYKYPACHGRSIHKLAVEVTQKYDESREKLKKFINAKNSKEVVFTRNTTESINLVANSLKFDEGDVVITTDREHNSNLLPWQFLSKKQEVTHKVLFSNDDNTFNLEKFEETMSKDVRLVSMVHTSNLDGHTIPVKEIIKIAHDYGALVMLDGAQSAPHKQVDVSALDVDLFAFSIHKMLGPSGVGVLYGKYSLLEDMSPFLVGGDTVKNTTYDSCTLMEPPEKFEAGLQNYAGVIGAGAAADYLMNIGKENVEKYEHELNALLTEGVNEIEGISIIGPSDPALRGGIVSFTVDGMETHDIAIILDETENIMIRSGRHCVHSWFNAHNIEGSARVSMYIYNTKEEVELFVETLKQIIGQLS